MDIAYLLLTAALAGVTIALIFAFERLRQSKWARSTSSVRSCPRACSFIWLPRCSSRSGSN